MRKSSGAPRVSNGAPQHGAAVRMACGDCWLAACYVKERAGEAIAREFDISMSDECVLVECTSAQCDQGGQLHKECYDRLERDLIARVTSAASRTAELMSKGDWNNIIWSTGSQGKYKALKKQCGCACGHGTFIPQLTANGQVRLRGGSAGSAGGEPVDTAEERRRLIEAKLARQRELHKARARDEKDQGVAVGGAGTGATGAGDAGGDDQGVAELEAEVEAGIRGEVATAIAGSQVAAAASGGGGRAPTTKRDKRKAAKKRREESDIMMKQVQETIVQGEERRVGRGMDGRKDGGAREGGGEGEGRSGVVWTARQHSATPLHRATTHHPVPPSEQRPRERRQGIR